MESKNIQTYSLSLSSFFLHLLRTDNYGIEKHLFSFQLILAIFYIYNSLHCLLGKQGRKKKYFFFENAHGNHNI